MSSPIMPGQRTYTIAEVLPHAPPLLLLDELLAHGPEFTSCAVTIRPDTMFCDGVNGVPAWVGLEYMAQTLCTLGGIEEVSQGLKPSIGLLLGSRRYSSDVTHFRIGTRLRIVANLLLRDESDLVAFDCEIDDGDRVIARGDIKAYRPKDVMAVIRGERIS
jgi:predicted hotdog family 3-hydroxylacyl-ACP dehydratase